MFKELGIFKHHSAKENIARMCCLRDFVISPALVIEFAQFYKTTFEHWMVFPGIPYMWICSLSQYLMLENIGWMLICSLISWPQSAHSCPIWITLMGKEECTEFGYKQLLGRPGRQVVNVWTWSDSGCGRLVPLVVVLVCFYYQRLCKWRVEKNWENLEYFQDMGIFRDMHITLHYIPTQTCTHLHAGVSAHACTHTHTHREN